MKTKLFIGIDPGAAGAIAIIDEGGSVLSADKMPGTPADILEEFDIDPNFYDVRAALEHVWSSPVMGKASAFTFGRCNGHLEMALTAKKIPFDLILPQTWMKALSCSTKGVIGKKRANKNITKRRAQALFPVFAPKITHANADALLIAEFIRRAYRGANRRKSDRVGGK